MARTRVWRLLQAYRGKPAAAIDAIAEVLIRLGQLAADHAEIRELDINPLLADAAGVIALDARIRVRRSSHDRGGTPGDRALSEASRERRAACATAPWSQLRPVRPEDEPLLHDLAAHMSPEDLRLRFFTPVRGLTHVARGATDADRLRPRDGAAGAARRARCSGSRISSPTPTG